MLRSVDMDRCFRDSTMPEDKEEIILYYDQELLFVQIIFPSRELSKLSQGDINTKLATANLSHTNIGLASLIMNYTNQEIVIQLLHENLYSSYC